MTQQQLTALATVIRSIIAQETKHTDTDDTDVFYELFAYMRMHVRVEFLNFICISVYLY